LRVNKVLPRFIPARKTPVGANSIFDFIEEGRFKNASPFQLFSHQFRTSKGPKSILE